MFVYTFNRDSVLKDSLEADSLARLEEEEGTELNVPTSDETVKPTNESGATDEATTPDAGEDAESDHEAQTETAPEVADSSQLSKKELKRIEAEKKRQAREKIRQQKEQERMARMKAREERWKQKEAQRKRNRLQAMADSVARADSIARAELLQRQRDSLTQLAKQQADTLQPQVADTVTTEQDSLVRKVFGYHNVRIYRHDFQAVCDSMTGFTLDSTLHMYVDPVLWNDNNQVTSQWVDIYTRNQKIDRAVFVGNPILCQQVDTAHYNQIKGKEIESYFRDGTIYRTDVNGNGQTYYFMVEEDSLGSYISGFMTVECADISFYFKDQTVDEIVWRGKPVYSIYPMDKIPDDQPMRLPGFSWQGDRRPTQEQVFNRTFRPSERALYELIPRPTFPLTQKINKAREELIKAKVWLDRNDPLSQEAVEFIQSLDYE